MQAQEKYILTSLAGAKAENFPPEFKGTYSPGGLGVFSMISASQPPRTFLMWSQRNARNFPQTVQKLDIAYPLVSLLISVDFYLKPPSGLIQALSTAGDGDQSMFLHRKLARSH